MAVERYGSKTDVVVKLVLVFFISLLSFSIGTFVGKKFSDNQHRLAQLEGGAEHVTASEDTSTGEDRGVASIDPHATDLKPEKVLTDDEIAKLAEEFISDEEGTPGSLEDSLPKSPVEAKADDHGKANAPTAAAQPTNSGGKHEPSVAATRMTEGKSPVVANKPIAPSRIPTALPKEAASSAVGKFTVQIGAFPDEKEAQTKSAELKDQGFSAFYVSAKVKGQTWYRVSVGLFSTQKEAEAYRKDLIDRKKVTQAIIQKISSVD